MSPGSSNSNLDRIKTFFNDEDGPWHPRNYDFQHSGEAVVAEVLAMKPRFVLDVGCGYNLFKGRIPNLIGVDIANRQADLVCDMLDAPFADESFDAILALGSINFGDEDLIRRQLEKVRAWLTPEGRAFVRLNQGGLTSSIDYFPWNRERVATLGAEVGLAVDGEIVDDEDRRAPDPNAAHRLYFRWRRA